MRKSISLYPFVSLLLLYPSLFGNPPLNCQISVTGGETSICKGQPLLLIAKVDDGLSEVSGHRWETDGKLLSASDQAFVKLDTEQPGLYQVKYFAWDEEGNQGQCFLDIRVEKLPEFEIVENFGFLQRILFKKPKPLIRIYSEENHTFQWFLDGAPIAGAIGPELKSSKGGRYQAVVTSPLGCRSYSKEIIVE